MNKKFTLFITFLILLFIPGAYALNVVSTTTVLWDPVQYIGGEKVHAIYIADPTICPHMQADIIPNRMQMQRDFIRGADLFIAHNGSVDVSYVMPFVDDFMEANHFGTVKWVTLKNPSMIWNTPDGAKALSQEVAGWLIAADPANREYYESRLAEYLAQIGAADISTEERKRIAGQDIVVMVWQQEAAGKWLGMDTVSIYAPEFYMGGKFTPVKIVDDINANITKYQEVRYIIENMQSGELAKGLEEALHTKGIPAKRVIFTNFPKSIPGVDTLPDVIRYNKALVTPEDGITGQPTGAPTTTPLSCVVVAGGILGAFLLFLNKRED